MSLLFEPFDLAGTMLSNRVVMAPMTRARAESTVPDDQTVLYYQQRATAGLIVSEGAPVSLEGRGYLFNPGLYTEAQSEGWKRVTDAVHARGGKIFAQLWHVGRMSHVSLQPAGQPPVSSMAIAVQNSRAYAYDDQGKPGHMLASPPRALKTEEMSRIAEDFSRAAALAIGSGFDGVEIHGANGYLFEQFINGALNQRTDRYGGSIENRLRLLLETTDAVASTIGSQRTGVRISPFGRLFEMAPYPDEDSTWIVLASEMNKRNIAYLHLSDQLTLGQQKMPDGFAHGFRQEFRGTLIAAGNFNQVTGEAALASGDLDLIAFGRPFISNPDLVERMKNGWPLAEPDVATFYGNHGAVGYTDYLEYQPSTRTS